LLNQNRALCNLTGIDRAVINSIIPDASEDQIQFQYFSNLSINWERLKSRDQHFKLGRQTDFTIDKDKMLPKVEAYMPESRNISLF